MKILTESNNMINNMIVVSTITPCYKGERYLETFLNELPKQTYFDKMEIVLDHNEPTEKELELVSKFMKQYPGRLKHIVVNPVDPIGVSMNRCIAEAQGEYVCIWNIDDLRTPDSIEKQAELLDIHSEFGIAHGNFTIVNKFGSTEGTFIDHSWTIQKPQELTRGMMLGPFFMWRKALCEKVGYFDEQLKTGADFDLAIRLAANTDTVVLLVEDSIGYYLDEGKGASTNGSGKQEIERTLIEMRYNIFDKVEEKYLVPALTNYNKNVIVNFGKEIPVEELICASVLSANDKRSL